MKKPAIPSPTGLGEVSRVLNPIKETLDIITGVRSGEIETLDSDATLEDVVAKVKEIIARLNRSGA